MKEFNLNCALWSAVGAFVLSNLFASLTIAADAKVNEAALAKFLIADTFEKGGAAPEGWEQGAAIPGVKYVWERKAASHGERSLGLRKTEDRYFPIAQWMRTVPHQEKAPDLKVSVKVKAVKATKAIVDVLFFDGQGGMVGHDWAAYIGAKNDGDKPVTHDWKKYDRTVAIPDGTARIGIGLQIYGPGSVWFDELLVKYVDDAKEKPQPSAEAEREEVAEEDMPTPIKVAVGQGEGEYLFAPAREKPAGLLVVLPGGDGSADFHPFVRNIGRGALEGRYAVAQPLATKWTAEQEIVWPSAKLKVPGMKFGTEDLVAKVVEDVAGKHKIDRKRVFVLGWSSGGPPSYATLMQKESPATGALVAMSVYQPNYLPAPKNAAGRSFYILHSRQDQVCPFRMAEQARDVLKRAGAIVEFAEYDGGHGWHGDIFGNIRAGVDWLEKSVAEKK
jgi:predicted esterase